MQTVEEIYQQYVKHLPNNEKLRLIAMIALEMAEIEYKKLKQINSDKSEN